MAQHWWESDSVGMVMTGGDRRGLENREGGKEGSQNRVLEGTRGVGEWGLLGWESVVEEG